jgi:phytoene dehydrogenase-like protein
VRKSYDAVVVGAGPNGLAAGIALLHAGWSVLLVEAAPTPGGGARSSEQTLAGFVHDCCSAIHPFAVGSPFFRTLPLDQHGLSWRYPAVELAHPLDGGQAALIYRSLEETAAGLGPDGPSYLRLIRPLAASWELLAEDLLGPLTRFPKRPLRVAAFGLHALRSASGLAASAFKTEKARALFAGLGGHAIAPLDQPMTASIALLLAAAAHAVGWPTPEGGSQRLTDALVSLFRSLGGELVLSSPVERLEDLPDSRAVLFDTSPKELLRICGEALPGRYRRAVETFRFGAGAFKVDYALDGPVPWLAEGCRGAGTLHLGGTLGEIAASEAAVAKGAAPERPYVLVAQQSVLDQSRAPQGKHTLWAYCHVPNGSTVDMLARIEAQLERFAPGFAGLVLARKVTSPAELAAYNRNYEGGDIAGGSTEGLGLIARPFTTLNPYGTGNPRLFLCSSSTPPGPGVHGMCGYFAARAALRVHG